MPAVMLTKDTMVGRQTADLLDFWFPVPWLSIYIIDHVDFPDLLH
jgi:hypothetical protein